MGLLAALRFKRRQVKTGRVFNEGDFAGAVSIVRGHRGREVSGIPFF